MIRRQPFTLEEERYLVTQISQGVDRIATKALQWICERVRQGYFFADTSKIRPVVRLCLFRESANARRWAVNTLAELGIGADVGAILQLAPHTESDPDLMASIVGAVYSSKSEDEAEDLLLKANIPLDGLALISSSRFSLRQKQRLVESRVPLETSDPAELRAAIVLAGTGNAPEHLFESRHTNAIALSQLNLHDVSTVSKYSIWAIAQMRLGFSSLLINTQDIESYAPEVRKWIYRLLFSDEIALPKNLDFIETARKDKSDEVREEAAIELRDSFVSDMERLVGEWFFREVNEEVRRSILDHMAAQSARAHGYSDIVKEIYRKEPVRSDARVRIEAAAAKTPLYRELRRIDHEDESGRLFANDNEGRGPPMVTINQNFANSQIGSVTGTGSISAETIQAVGQADSSIKEVLEKVIGLLNHPALSPQRSEGEGIVKEVAIAPSPTAWKRLLGFLNGVKDASTAVGGAIQGVDGLIGEVTDLANLG